MSEVHTTYIVFSLYRKTGVQVCRVCNYSGKTAAHPPAQPVQLHTLIAECVGMYSEQVHKQ
jgi:hypothetical protein